MEKKSFSIGLLIVMVAFTTQVKADDYKIDTKGAHAFIQFRIKHLGYSWLYGRFNEFTGNFRFDEKKPEEAKFEVEIKMASIDSNHAERDKHLRGKDFLEVKKYPTAKFESTKYRSIDANNAALIGNLSLHGVTKLIVIDVQQVGDGDDPWGGFRRGFEGTTSLKLADFGIDYNLGPASTEVELILSIEGVRQLK